MDVAACTWDATIPDAEQPKYVAGFYECRATQVLLEAQQKQADRDEAERKKRGKSAPPIPTGHRRWFIRPAEPGERGR